MITNVILPKNVKIRLCDCKGAYRIKIKAPKNNKGTVYLGDSTVTLANGFPIDAGEWVELPVMDYNTLYVIGTEGDSLNLLIWS